MKECPYCVDGEGFPIEMRPVEADDRTGSRRYICPECGYEMWD